jgi:hypothetical protein
MPRFPRSLFPSGFINYISNITLLSDFRLINIPKLYKTLVVSSLRNDRETT